MKKKIAFHTLGCKLNFSETSTIARGLQESKYEISDFKAHADIYVIHSCAVTAAAEKKCKQLVRHVKRENPDSKIVVMGCFAQLKPGELSKIKEIDLLLGSKEKFKLPDYLDQLGLEDNKKAIDPGILKDKEFTPSYSLSDRTRSFLKVQDGCDYFCTFCTIPYARGRSRSSTVEQAVKAAGIIASQGIQEIVITGVNIGHFNNSLYETFFDLIMALDQVDGITRYRISSIEPDLLTDQIIEFVSSSGKFLPHFHIPLQSGSDKILKAMKRKYPRETFASRIIRIKELMPDCCIAADVIVGFPGETAEDFEETYSFIEGLPVSYIHVFSYSERPGTPAVKLPEKVPGNIIKDRSRRLHKLSDLKKQQFYLENKHRKSKVLFESDPHKDHLFGFTENYIKVKTPFDRKYINKIVTLTLEKQDNNGVYVYSY